MLNNINITILMVRSIPILYSDFLEVEIILTWFLLPLNKSILIKFQNDHIFQHNGFINADKKYLDTFLSKKMRL